MQLCCKYCFSRVGFRPSRHAICRCKHCKATKQKHALPEKKPIYQIGFSSLILLLASVIFQEKGIIHYTPLLAGALACGIFLVASASYPSHGFG
jgi:hypothetical protein